MGLVPDEDGSFCEVGISGAFLDRPCVPNKSRWRSRCCTGAFMSKSNDSSSFELELLVDKFLVRVARAPSAGVDGRCIAAGCCEDGTIRSEDSWSMA